MDKLINIEHIKKNAEKFDSFARRLYVSNKPKIPTSERIMLMNINVDLAALIDAYNHLNDFEQTQSYKLLSDNARLRAEIDQVKAERDAALKQYQRKCESDVDDMLPIEYGGTIHHLKTVQPYYNASAIGIKTFEIRKDDRGYQVGDVLRLYEWDGEKETGHSHYKQVTYALRDAPYVPDGYVCLACCPESAEAVREAKDEWRGPQGKEGR